MIIACPECAGPFELRDNDVAALVQLACPHCRFTMILDFAAANDANLVEAGMRMASGYRSAADYRRAASPEVHVAEVAQAPADIVAAPPIEAPRPVEVVRTPPTTVPVAPPASTPPPVAASAGISTRFEEYDDDVSETVVRTVPKPSPTAVPVTPAGGRSTVIGMVPPAAHQPAARGPADTDTEPARSRSEALAAAGIPVAISEERDAPIGTPPPREPARAEAPARPATPPQRTEAPSRAPATSRPTEDQPRTRPAAGRSADAAATPSRVPVAPPPAAEIEPEDRPRSGMFGAIILVVLLLLAVGLTVASVLQKNTPDPRPLLEDLYRQYIKP